MTARRIVFWAAVAGMGVLGSFAVALVANKTGQPGLQQFRAFTYGVTNS